MLNITAFVFSCKREFTVCIATRKIKLEDLLNRLQITIWTSDPITCTNHEGFAHFLTFNNWPTRCYSVITRGQRTLSEERDREKKTSLKKQLEIIMSLTMFFKSGVGTSYLLSFSLHSNFLHSLHILNHSHLDILFKSKLENWLSKSKCRCLNVQTLNTSLN